MSGEMTGQKAGRGYKRNLAHRTLPGTARSAAQIRMLSACVLACGTRILLAFVLSNKIADGNVQPGGAEVSVRRTDQADGGSPLVQRAAARRDRREGVQAHPGLPAADQDRPGGGRCEAPPPPGQAGGREDVRIRACRVCSCRRRRCSSTAVRPISGRGRAAPSSPAPNCTLGGSHRSRPRPTVNGSGERRRRGVVPAVGDGVRRPPGP
jgi:hypothetical protein